MRTIIDTSSLVCMAQYFNPFDDREALNSFLRTNMENGTFIILDRVIDEVRNVSQAIAYQTFSCLGVKKLISSTVGLQPSRRFFHMLDHNFVDKAIKKLKLGDDDSIYQNARDNYLQGADCGMIVYAMNAQNQLEPIQILTEESPNQNDGKLFKKIPSICRELNIPTVNIVGFFKQHEDEIQVEVRAR